MIAKVKAKTRKEKVWQLVTCEAKTFCSRLLEKQYSRGCKGGALVTTHIVGQQQTQMNQQNSLADTKLVVEGLRTVSQLSLICEKDMIN